MIAAIWPYLVAGLKALGAAYVALVIIGLAEKAINGGEALD